MTIIHTLFDLAWDRDLILLINSWHNPWMDAFMYSISNPIVWLPLIALLLYYIVGAKPKQEIILLLLCLGLCLVLGHLLGNILVKPWLARPRPTFTEGIAEHLHWVYNYTARSYSFFSGHSCNFFAGATFLSFIVGRRLHSLLVYTLASIVAYSRMYQGVHFPTDILVGIAVGISLGYIAYRLLLWLRHKFRLSHTALTEVYSPRYTLWRNGLILFPLLLLVASYQTASIVERL